jgi:glyceraldehyde 3-phosphate dehydrogenase
MFSSKHNHVKLTTINSIHSIETAAHLLKYDTVHGTWNADISIQDGKLLIVDDFIQIVSERELENIP